MFQRDPRQIKPKIPLTWFHNVTSMFLEVTKDKAREPKGLRCGFGFTEQKGQDWFTCVLLPEQVTGRFFPLETLGRCWSALKLPRGRGTPCTQPYCQGLCFYL